MGVGELVIISSYTHGHLTYTQPHTKIHSRVLTRMHAHQKHRDIKASITEPSYLSAAHLFTGDTGSN